MIIPTNNFIERFKKTRGAFSVCEAIALFNIVMDAPKGLYIELGSHRGKSSQVIAGAMDVGSILILVEPEFKDQLWLEGVSDLINDVNPDISYALDDGYSLDVLPNHKDISFCFVDSGVHDDMVMDEVKMLEDKMIPNGIIAFHDYGNQFTAVARAYNYLLSTGKYEPIKIDWERIFNYVRENNLEEGNDSWHERGSEEFPKFVGALKRKETPDFVHRY